MEINRLPIVDGICVQEREEMDQYGKSTGRMVAWTCDRVMKDQNTCIAYADPRVWVTRGGCPMCSIPTEKQEEQTKKVNALKASKRKFRGQG